MFVLRVQGGEFDLSFTDVKCDAIPSIDRGTYVLFCKTWVASLGDSPLCTTNRIPKPLRVLQVFARRDLAWENLPNTVSLYSTLADTLSRVPTISETGLDIGFLDKGMFKTPIAKEYLVWRETKDVRLYDFMYNFLKFGKKLPIETVADPDIALRAWWEVESRMQDFTVPEWAGCLHDLLMEEISEPQPVLDPSFSTGSVAEKKTKGLFMKATTLAYDAKVDRALYKGLYSLSAYAERATPYERGVKFNPHRFDRWQNTNDAINDLSSDRMKEVTKDFGKGRIMCMPPLAYAFGQQAVRKSLEKSIDESDVFSQIINIKDQHLSQIAAGYGSVMMVVDTLDLSNASDSVPWELIKAMFPRKWVILLGATRTKTIAIRDGSGEYAPLKFAPMGSAVCFPIQSIVYASVVVFAYYLHSQGWHPGDVIPSRAPKLAQWFRGHVASLPGGGKYVRPVVYGDDIACDHRATHIVIILLEALGFVINKAKSFTSTQAFRESCGAYFFEGEDVTPTLWKAKAPYEEIDGDTLEPVTDLANRLGQRGWSKSRRCIIHYMVNLKMGGHILFTENAEVPAAFIVPKVVYYDPGGGPDCHTYQGKRRVRRALRRDFDKKIDQDFQRLEVKSLYPRLPNNPVCITPEVASLIASCTDGVMPAKEKGFAEYEKYRLLRTLADTAHRRRDPSLDGVAAPMLGEVAGRATIGWRWTPTW